MDFASKLTEDKIKFDYESRKIKYKKYDTIPTCTYTPDFPLVKKDGSLMYLETKGRFLSADRSKHLRVKKEHPDLDIRFVFQYDNWLTKTKTSKYSDWCIKKGFKYTVGTSIPKEWMEELK